MKKKNNVLFFTLVIFTIMMAFTCKQNVGLGGTVDIERPEGSITYPDAGETPIRGSFVMRGTAKDDDGIKSITISFKNVKTEEIVKSYSVGGFTEGDGSVSWSINIDNTSTGNEPEPHDLVKKYPIPDGEYTAILTVTDKGGKTYETTKNYKIDNTPPVFIVQRPYTSAGISETPSSGDGYGSVFSVVGQAGEQNIVKKLLVKVPNKTIKIEKMFVGKNINVKVETHKLPLPTENTLYKLQAEDINKAIKAQLFLFDNARLYNDESSSTDTEGNKSEWFYLWDDIYSEVIEKGYTPEVIMDYFAGKKGSDAADADDHDKSIYQLRNHAPKALKALKEKRINMGTDCSTFKLDPSKSPGFKVLGVDLLPNDPSEFNSATPILFKNGKENFFIAELVRNKDNKSIVPGDPLQATSYSGSDIEIKLSKWKGPSSPNDFEDGISVLKFSALTQNNLTKDNLITVISGGNLRVKCKLPNVFEEGKYRVEVKGTDTGGANFAPYDVSNTVTSKLYIIDFLQAGEGVKVKAASIKSFYNKKVKIEAKVTGLNPSGNVYYNIGTKVSETSPDPSKKLDPDGSDRYK